MSAAPKFGIDVGGGREIPLEGWDALDGLLDEQISRQLQENVDHASMYRAAFSTGAGAYVLKDMMGVHMRKMIVTPGATQFEAGIRQGEANAVMRILALIEFANRGGKLTGAGAPSQEE